MREIKFKVVWNNEVSNEAFTIGEFVDGVEMSFKDGGTLPFKDIDWSEDKIEYLQYTGLKDKNGVEIYEGDVVRHDAGEGGFIFEVKWDKKQPGWNLYICNSIDMQNSKIIGNIYQNPELLTNN